MRVLGARFWLGLGASLAIIGAVAGITLGVLTLAGITLQGEEAEGQTPEPVVVNNGALITANRDRLAICVRAIGLGEGAEGAVEAEVKSAVETALAQAAVQNPQWTEPRNKLADNPPLVETNCEAPSAVYEPVDPALPPDALFAGPRLVAGASSYLFVIFVIPDAEIDRLTGGLPRDQSVRVVPEEGIMDEGDVGTVVTYGIYLTASEAKDTAILVDWVEKGLGFRDIYTSQ
jgi:hypothetical protein